MRVFYLQVAKQDAEKKAIEAEELAEKLQRELEAAAAESASNLESMSKQHEHDLSKLKVIPLLSLLPHQQ